MKNDVSIVDLAGALTLPLISELFVANSNLTELKRSLPSIRFTTRK